MPQVDFPTVQGALLLHQTQQQAGSSNSSSASAGTGAIKGTGRVADPSTPNGTRQPYYSVIPQHARDHDYAYTYMNNDPGKASASPPTPYGEMTSTNLLGPDYECNYDQPTSPPKDARGRVRAYANINTPLYGGDVYGSPPAALSLDRLDSRGYVAPSTTPGSGADTYQVACQAEYATTAGMATATGGDPTKQDYGPMATDTAGTTGTVNTVSVDGATATVAGRQHHSIVAPVEYCEQGYYGPLSAQGRGRSTGPELVAKEHVYVNTTNAADGTPRHEAQVHSSAAHTYINSSGSTATYSSIDQARDYEYMDAIGSGSKRSGVTKGANTEVYGTMRDFQGEAVRNTSVVHEKISTPLSPPDPRTTTTSGGSKEVHAAGYDVMAHPKNSTGTHEGLLLPCNPRLSQRYSTGYVNHPPAALCS